MSRVPLPPIEDVRKKRRAGGPIRPWRERPIAWVLILMTVAAAVGVAVYYLMAPRPPTVNLGGADPAVAGQILSCRRQAILMPWSASVWGRLGSLYYDYDFSEAADACLARAGQLAPANPRWVYLRGRSMGEQNPDAALPMLRRAAELCGDSPAAPHLKYAEVLVERGQLDQAEAQFRRVLSLNPHDARALLGMGRVCLDRGQLDEARHYLEQSTEARSDVKAAHALLATVYQRQGDGRSAAQELRQAGRCPESALWDDPFLGEALGLRVGKKVELERAGRLLDAGNAAEAVAALRNVTERYPTAADAWTKLSLGYLQNNELGSAESAARTAVRLDPKLPDAHNKLGEALYARQQYQAAAASFAQSLQLRPQDGSVWYNLGLCRQAQQDAAGAAAAFAAAVRHDPELVAGYVRLGQALIDSGRSKQAVQPLRHALELNPDDSETRALLQQASQ